MLIYIGSLDDKIITYGLIAAFVVSLIVFIYNVVTIRSESKINNQIVAEEKLRSAGQSAQAQIDRIRENTEKGNNLELKNDYDTTMLYATIQEDYRCASEYLSEIKKAHFYYYGNRYPNRNGAPLDKVIHDEIKMHYNIYIFIPTALLNRRAIFLYL